MSEPNKRIVPKFATEAEEAEWWYQHREEHGKELLATVRSGEAQVLTREKIEERLRASEQQPVYLKREVHDALAAAADRKGVSLAELVNDLLAKDVAIAESLK